MDFFLEFEQETDGRWIAEIPELPGVLAYGLTHMQAGEKAKALALRVLAERMESENSIDIMTIIRSGALEAEKENAAYFSYP